jgi:hypothetical protein
MEARGAGRTSLWIDRLPPSFAWQHSERYLHPRAGMVSGESGRPRFVHRGIRGRDNDTNNRLGWAVCVFGWLRDDGTKVVAVDATGAVIPYRFEGGW